MELLFRLQRKLAHAKKLKDELEEKYKDTTKFTFHAGFDLGYLKGKIAVLEEWIDELEEK